MNLRSQFKNIEFSFNSLKSDSLERLEEQEIYILSQRFSSDRSNILVKIDKIDKIPSRAVILRKLMTLDTIIMDRHNYGKTWYLHSCKKTKKEFYLNNGLKLLTKNLNEKQQRREPILYVDLANDCREESVILTNFSTELDIYDLEQKLIYHLTLVPNTYYYSGDMKSFQLGVCSNTYLKDWVLVGK